MDLQTLLPLASSAATLIVSYLTKAGESISKKAGEDLYGAVKSHFQQNQKLLDSLEKAPSGSLDPETQDELEKHILSALLTDESFRCRIQTALSQISESAAEMRIEQHGGDHAIQIGTVGRDAHIRNH